MIDEIIVKLEGGGTVTFDADAVDSIVNDLNRAVVEGTPEPDYSVDLDDVRDLDEPPECAFSTDSKIPDAGQRVVVWPVLHGESGFPCPTYGVVQSVPDRYEDDKGPCEVVISNEQQHLVTDEVLWISNVDRWLPLADDEGGSDGS